MIKAASLPIDIDLAGFSQFLLSQGLSHRINEESGQQVIWVKTEAEAEFVRQSLHSWSQGMEARQQAQESAKVDMLPGKGFVNRVLAAFISSPITLCLILACLLVAAISSLGAEAQRVDMLFYPRIESDGVFALLADVDSLAVFLRTLTPMFLHFGELHLIFNMLWLWYFGKQLESIQPAWVFMLLVLITSFISNTAQYMYVDYNNFGGMSGVVYGLLGYTWVIHSFMPRSYLLLNKNMFVFFVIALVLMEFVAGAFIATAAHVGGLLSGLVIGVAMVLYYRLVLKRQVIGRTA